MGRPLLQRARRGFEPPGRVSANDVVHADTVEVVVVRNGGQRVRLGRSVFECNDGDYGIAAAGTTFSSWTERRGLDFSLFAFDAEGLAALADETAKGTVVESRVAPASRNLVTAADQIERELHDAEQPGHALALESLAVVLGLALVRVQVTSRTTEVLRDDALARVEERLRSELSVTPSLNELATIAGTSRYALLRAFRRRYGAPPARYQQKLRAERARDLLVQGPASISAVAAELGYGSPSRLSEAMRRFFGTTPTAILRNPAEALRAMPRKHACR